MKSHTLSQRYSKILVLLMISVSTAMAVEPYFRETPGFKPEKLGNGAISAAVMGDSLTHDFYTANDKEALDQMKNKRQGNWFVADPVSKVKSLFGLLAAEEYPTRAANYARVSAYIPANVKTDPFKKLVGSVQDLDDQVTTILKEPHFPNLILTWIGHNNLDWKYDCNKNTKLNPEKYRSEIPAMVANVYVEQLQRLIEQAKKQDYPVIIVVYNLGDLEGFLNTRDLIEIEKKKDPKLYPEFARVFDHFPSLLPENQKATIELWKSVNEAVTKKVKALGASLKEDMKAKNITVVVSDAFTNLKIDDRKLLHDQDGWHLSPMGHSRFAKASYEMLGEYLPKLKK